MLKNLKTNHHNKRGICNVIRHIYFLVEREDTKKAVERAFIEAKKLNQQMIDNKVWDGFAKYFDVEEMSSAPREIVESGVFYRPKKFTLGRELLTRQMLPELLQDEHPLMLALTVVWCHLTGTAHEHLVLEAFWMARRMLKKYRNSP